MERVEFDNIFRVPPFQLLTVECEEDKWRMGDRRRVLGWHRTNIPMNYYRPNQENIRYWFNDIEQVIRESFPTGFDIYVDGAWSKGEDNASEIFLLPNQKKNNRGASSLILVSKEDDWEDIGIISIILKDGEMVGTSAYQMELIAIMAALDILNKIGQKGNRVYSDCKAAVEKMDKPASFVQKSTHSSVLSRSYRFQWK